jgi:hypothetical protein
MCTLRWTAEINFFIFFFLAQQPNSGHGRLILEVSRSRAMTNDIL